MDYFARLIAVAQGLAPVVEPRLAARFEPQRDTSGFELVETEIPASGPAPRARAVPPRPDRPPEENAADRSAVTEWHVQTVERAQTTDAAASPPAVPSAGEQPTPAPP